MNDSIQEFTNGLRVYRHHLSSLPDIADLHESELQEIFHALMSAIPDAGCFVNIGSSIGFYTLLAKRYFPRINVHAYEPLERHRRFFAENVELNGLQLSDFKIYEEGVSRTDGHVEFYNNRFGSTVIDKRTATLAQRLKQVRLKIRRRLQQFGIKDYQLEISSIPVVSLKTVVERAGGEIDFLLMDIQGSEGDVLAGGLKSLQAGSVRTLLISTHGVGLHNRCIKLLKKCGFLIEYDERKTKGDGAIVASHRAGGLQGDRGRVLSKMRPAA